MRLLITCATMFGFAPCIEMILMELILILHTTIYTVHSSIISQFKLTGRGRESCSVIKSFKTGGVFPQYFTLY